MTNISEEYKAFYQHVFSWKTHANELYNYCQTQMLEWPSLTVDWLPDRKNLELGREFSLQYLAVGTQALPGSQNYISVIEFALPIEMDDFETYYDASDMDRPPGPITFDEVRGHTRVDQVLNTDSQILRIRAMPQTSDIIAVKLSSGYTHVYDLRHHPKVPHANAVPNIRLRGHKKAGFGIDWNPTRLGHIASGGDDELIQIWDIESTLDEHDQRYSADEDRGTRTEDLMSDVTPFRTLKGHTDAVQCVSWHSTQEHILASCGDDKSIRLHDVRAESSATIIDDAHTDCVYGVDFHPVAAFQFASCSADRIIGMWDMRKTAAPVYKMLYHSNIITGVKWAPFSDTVLATCGNDRRVVMWDMAKLNQPAVGDGDANAPAELSFVHCGHLTKVTDFAWCPSMEEEWMMASVDMTNALQIYKPSREIVYDYMQGDAFDEDNTE